MSKKSELSHGVRQISRSLQCIVSNSDSRCNTADGTLVFTLELFDPRAGFISANALNKTKTTITNITYTNATKKYKKNTSNSYVLNSVHKIRHLFESTDSIYHQLTIYTVVPFQLVLEIVIRISVVDSVSTLCVISVK